VQLAGAVPEQRLGLRVGLADLTRQAHDQHGIPARLEKLEELILHDNYRRLA